IIGAVEGYYGGKVDMLMERIKDILSGVPYIVILTLINLHFVITGKMSQITGLALSFIVLDWIGFSALIRMQFYRFKGQEYVLAARTLGASDGRLMLKHIFPNSLGTIVTSCALAIPSVIFAESAYSYLGLVNFDSAKLSSLGSMLSSGSGYMMNYPHIILFPSIAISLLMICFNLFGNGLRDAFNPTLRGTHD
ncbi:MAG: ABC transporter permease, partial [Christensenellaceae bacterium]|nr:ABC transporter permease [Christensenellaceae bacterium]